MAKRRFEGVAGRLLAAAASTALSLVLAECALRVFAPAREVGAAFTQYDAYYGKRLKSSASLVRETPEFTMHLATNRLGFRGPEPPREPRDVLLFLGDSFTLGYGVNDGEEFPAHIAEQLGGDPSVVNASIGDAGNGRWLLFLRRDAAPLAPRAVVLQVQENDFADNRRERLFALADGALTALPVPPPSFGRRVQVWVDRVPGLAGLHLIGRLRLLVDRPAGAVGGGDGPAAPAADPLTLRLIDAALAECAARGRPALGLLADVRGERERAVTDVFGARGADRAHSHQARAPRSVPRDRRSLERRGPCVRRRGRARRAARDRRGAAMMDAQRAVRNDRPAGRPIGKRIERRLV